MKSRAVALAAALGLLTQAGGCALLEPAAEQLARAVTRYCKEPTDTRSAIARQVNDHATPNAINIYCAADPKKP